MLNPDTCQEEYVAVVCGGQAHQVMIAASSQMIWQSLLQKPDRPQLCRGQVHLHN